MTKSSVHWNKTKSYSSSIERCFLHESFAGAPALNRPLQPNDSPCFVVTIDTEEEGLWSGDYASEGEVTNIRGIPRFQELCDRFAVRPTYLVDAPVVLSDEAVGILKPLQDEGRAEIGAHVHPWNTPPITEHQSRHHSYLCNLPVEIQRAKLTWLTEQIESRFGQRPRSFRAGRYGLDIEGAKILSELGYRVDSSVIPLTNYSSAGGPDFRSAPLTPYHVGGSSLIEPFDQGDLYEVPVTVGFTHRWFEAAEWMRSVAHRSPWRQLRMVGGLDRLGLASRVKLSPEQADAKQMIQLVDASLLRGQNAFVLMFHSSSLLPGFSPYVQDDSQLDEFFRRLERLFSYCMLELGFRNARLRDCRPADHWVPFEAV